ncbi:MAG: hypothetical protein WAW39_11610, partial [Prosthecobacter sp.]|uniref:RCC1 domain-containing protein n=1 Tax=Prosthecobacter sp. TaxID=1965333 RepID=UPI003BAE58CB
MAVTSSGVLSGKTVIAVSAGNSHSLALCSDGTVAAWGLNTNGQLGNNSTAQSTVPVTVTTSGALSGKTVTAVSAGGSHSLTRCSDGTVAAWGLNSYGQLGSSSLTQSTVPIAVSVSSNALTGKTVSMVASGQNHSAAVCSDGTVAMWGSNSNGQLGNGAAFLFPVPTPGTTTGTPLDGKTLIAHAAGGGHSLGLCSDGTLAAWGSNFNGQLGNNATASSGSVPVAVTTSGVLSGKTVIAVSAGNSHSLALCSDGTVASWGLNTNGQLGNNSTTQSTVPVAVITSGI